MTSLKGTILGCITFLVTVGVIITYFSQQDRYASYTHEKGIFVFDRKTATLNFCDSQICQMIRPVLPLQDADVVMNGMSGMPSQNSIVNGSIPMSAPAITPQGAMVQPMMQGYQSVPQQQTPIQIVSPIVAPKAAAAAAAPSTDKKSDKDSKPAKDKAAKTDDKKTDSASDDNKDDDSTDDNSDSSDTTEADDASDSSTDDSSDSEDD